MKKFVINMLSLAAITALVVSMAGFASAAAISKDESKLNAAITMLNYDAKLPQGEKTIMKQLTDSFNVGSDKISALLSRNVQYGEVAAILAFADKMSGGITDANINRVMNMRQGRTGWDQLGKSLDVDTGGVANKISSIEDDAHKNIKQAFADSFAAGRAAGGVEESTGETMGGPHEGMPGGPGGTSGGESSGGAGGGRY